MKKLIMAAVAAIVALSGCTDNPEGQQSEQELSSRAQTAYNRAQPPHTYDASQARANLIAAHDAMAHGADSWTVQYVEGVGITFECPSVGFPIPYGTNITNPDQIIRYNGYGFTVPMMEPYGLYPPADVPATYANCVLPNGEVGIFYSEPMLSTFLFDVEFDQAAGVYSIPADAEATVQVTRVEDVQQSDADLDDDGGEDE